MNLPTVPCKRCSEPTEMNNTRLCDPCWEMDRHGVFDLQAENRKLARWVRHLVDNLECPACPGEADVVDSHADDCEFAAWLRKEDSDG